MQQTEICFNLDPRRTRNAPISAAEWRGKLSGAGKKGILPHWFFHRAENGERRQDTPTVRFLGGHGCLRIVAFGDKASNDLIDLSSLLFRLMCTITDRSVPYRVIHHNISADYSDYPMMYTARSPIMARRVKGSDRYNDDADPVARKALIETRIADGLRRQADFFGLDIPVESVDLAESGKFRIKQVHDGWAYGVEFALFSLTARLRGIWQIGNLLSHGHGVIVPYRADQADRTAARAAA